MRDSLLLLCLSNDAMFQRVQRFVLIMSFIKTKCCLLNLKVVTLNDEDDNSKYDDGVFFLVFFLADKKAWEKVDVLYVTWHFFNTHTRSVWVDIREHLKISLNIWGRQVAVGSESVDGADKDNPSSPEHFFNAFKA